MKKTYFKPEFKVVKLQSRTSLLVGSPVGSVGGNVFNTEVKAGSGTARSRGDGDWEDEEFAE